MNSNDYKKLKQRIEEKYQETIALAERERMEGLAAIDKVWKMLHKTRKRSVSRKKGDSPEYGSLKETVVKSLDFVPKSFTKNHVKLAMKQVNSELAEKCNPNSLSGCLIRLEGDGVIIKVTKGKGSKPSEYVKKEDKKEFLQDKQTDNDIIVLKE